MKGKGEATAEVGAAEAIDIRCQIAAAAKLAVEDILAFRCAEGGTASIVTRAGLKLAVML